MSSPGWWRNRSGTKPRIASGCSAATGRRDRDRETPPRLAPRPCGVGKLRGSMRRTTLLSGLALSAATVVAMWLLAEIVLRIFFDGVAPPIRLAYADIG